MSAHTWAELYLSHKTPASLIETGAIDVNGDPTEAVKLLDAFDPLHPHIRADHDRPKGPQ
jgi:hypothetical protein